MPRRYSKPTKIHAVAIAAMSSEVQASQATGIPRRTIGYWMNKPEFAQLRHKTREAIADEFWTAIQVGVREVASGLTGDAPLRDKAIALGILWDKHALLTGSATARTELRDLTGTLSDDDVRAAIQAAADLLGAGPLGAGAPAAGAPEVEGLSALPE